MANRLKLAAIVLVSVLVVGALAGAAYGAADRSRPAEEDAALEQLSPKGESQQRQDLVNWIEGLTAPQSTDGSELRVSKDPANSDSATPSDSGTVALLGEYEVVMREMAELWYPLEKEYQSADPKRREQLIVQFVESNEESLQSIRARAEKLEAELAQKEAKAGE